MKVAVFGSNGLFGTEIADSFEKRHDVIRLRGRKDGDITNANEIINMIKSIKPDLIVNATGYRNPDECKKNRNIALLINILGTKNLALAAKHLNCKLMHISSDSVFSGNTKYPYSEFDDPDPVNVYGFTKVAAEKEIKALTDKYFIIRVPMLFGFKGPKDVNLIFEVWNKLKKSEFIYAATDQICNPTYTKDSAEVLVKIAESDFYGLYHVSNEGIGSRYDLIKLISDLKGLNSRYILPINSESKDDHRSSYTVFNSIAFKNTFNIELDDWKVALKRCISDYEKTNITNI